MSSFLNLAKKSRTGDVWLLRTRDRNNRACYFYMRIDPLKKSILDRKKGETLTITDYGTVLESGFGENPPAGVAARMKAEYGFEEA